MSADLRGIDRLEMDDQKALLSRYVERIELAHVDGEMIIFKFKVGVMESELETETEDDAPETPENITKLLDICSRMTAMGRGSHTKMAS